jgi:RNA polymerase sigma factor (sigma-70 family)
MDKNLLDPADIQIEELFETCYGLVFSYIGKRMIDGSDIENLTAEVFMRAYRSLQGRYEPIEYPQKWLLKFANFVCLENLPDTGEYEVVSSERYTSLDGEENSLIGGLEEHNENYQPESAAEWHELLREVGKELETLSVMQQRAVLLHYTEGWTFEEIAKKYPSRAPSTVGNDARKGIKQLRVRLIHMKP